MTRRKGLLTTAVLGLMTGAGTGASAQPAPAPSPAAGSPAPVVQMARLEGGSLHGLVRDEAGAPVEGATVSAIGATMVFAVTDGDGRFAFDNLPAGQYLVRANRAGFSLAQREFVQVRSPGRVVKSLQLHRTSAVGTTGRAEPRIAAAGLAGEAAAQPEPAPADTAAAGSADPASPQHPHTESAWRLRHVRRSVLKDASEIIAVAEAEGPAPVTFARDAAYTSIFAVLPFSGEINLLTTSAFDRAGELFGSGPPRGITYVQLGNGSAEQAGWAVQGAVSHGDVASWIVAGSFSARGPRAHAFESGVSFGLQEYSGGNPMALTTRAEGTTRRAGAVYAFDNWTLSPRVHLSYGARVARYDYIDRQQLWSPRVALALNIAEGTHVRTSVRQRMRAPGAEEFLPAQTGGPWLPPERTFSPLGTDDFRVERIRQLEIAFEREFSESAVLSVRRFFERIDDQLVTIFGLHGDGVRADVGHYLVGTAGSVDADGWGVRLASPPTLRLRGALDYSMTRAAWAPDPIATASVARIAPSAARREREDVHDIATSVEADITETATRVFFYYRVSDGYARDDESPEPALRARFDLQVKQGLPFMPFRGSEWQVLVGIRDLFRDPLDGATSTYDELLVVRPPKRVVGGVQVKF